jgi:glycosyltransferase involved in cell wall biosynthesis
VISVVVPAHDEAAVIGRLLGSLQVGRLLGDEIVVACDGCGDETAAVARTFEAVRVLELPRGGKPSALNAGDRVSTRFPRFFVDADVDVTMATLHEIARSMTGTVHAGAPSCIVDTSRSSFLVRCYYDVWTRLPYFENRLLGSGVVGLTETGRSRFAEFPDVIADDDFVRRLFPMDERVTSNDTSSDVTFTISAPRTVGALLRIKTRSRLGVLQLNELQGQSWSTTHDASVRATVKLCRAPRLWFPVAVYATIRFVTHLRGARQFRRRDFQGWERDETSRAPGA